MSKRIAFIGACGSGKSTLAAKTFVALKEQRINAELIDEFVRGDIHAHGPMRSIWEQYRTRQHQKEKEDAVPKDVDVVIVDSGTLTPYFYAALYADYTDARQRLVMQDMYRYLLDDLYLKRYSHIFYVTPIKGANLHDGVRYQNEDEVSTLDQHMDLMFNQVLKGVGNVYRIDGSLEDRLTHVLSIV